MGMRKALKPAFKAWTLLSLILVPALLAWAQSPQAGKIAAIKVTGTRKFTEAQIAAASGLQIGARATRDDIQAAADRLAQLGFFASARYRFSSSGESIAVEFQLEEAPALPVSFDNFPWFTDAEITEALKQSVMVFDGTAPEQGSILDAMNETLQKLLATRGIQATVERNLMPEPQGDRMMQQFKVVGPSLRIDAVQFGDPVASESTRVRDRLSDLIGKPYSRFAIEVFANEQVRPVYLERGHLRVRIGTPVARFTGSPNRPLSDTVLVIVPIDPGPAYLWGSVQWHGNTAFQPGALDPLLNLKPGEIADGMKIAGAWERVRNEYSRLGYLDAKIEPEPVFDDAAKRVSYRVAITEGPVYRMGELVITGLSLAAERKLVQAWTLPRGQTFNGVYFDEFLQKGVKQVFADSLVHYDEVGHWLRKHPENGTVDVLLDFK